MNDAARLSRLLFEARELIDMYHEVIKGQTGIDDAWTARIGGEIDEYRRERGWSLNGFGGET